MNGVTPKLEHLMRRLFAGGDESESPHEFPRLATMLGAYRRVLLVLDRNSVPEMAARDLLARMPKGSLELVMLRLLPEWTQDSLETQTRDELGRVAARLTADERRVMGDVRRGEAVEQILRAGNEHGVELIVFVARRAGVSHWGTDTSVSAAVLRQAEVPVLVLHDCGRAELTPASCAR